MRLPLSVANGATNPHEILGTVSLVDFKQAAGTRVTVLPRGSVVLYVPRDDVQVKGTRASLSPAGLHTVVLLMSMCSAGGFAVAGVITEEPRKRNVLSSRLNRPESSSDKVCARVFCLHTRLFPSIKAYLIVPQRGFAGLHRAADEEPSVLTGTVAVLWMYKISISPN